MPKSFFRFTESECSKKCIDFTKMILSDNMNNLNKKKIKLAIPNQFVPYYLNLIFYEIPKYHITHAILIFPFFANNSKYMKYYNHNFGIL